MEATPQAKIQNRQKMQIPSLSIDKDGLRKLCDILQERAHSAAEIEVGLFQRRELSDEDYGNAISLLRESFTLKVTVSGKDGAELWGTIHEVFDSVNFPDDIKAVYVDSESTLKNVHNYYPHNSFTVFLDFSKPSIFDFSLMPSQNTPNESNLEVKGYNPTWVNGVFNELKMFIEKHSSTLSIVHNHSIYDVLAWACGYPFSFWVCYKFSPQIEAVFVKENTFLVNALYVYVFIATLFLFRILFHYLRWVCPLVEYRHKSNMVYAHRLFLAALSTAFFSNFVYDIVRAIF